MHLYFSTLLHFAAAYLMSQPIWTTSSLNPNFSLQNLAIELYCILHFSPGKLYYFQTLPPKFGPFFTLLSVTFTFCMFCSHLLLQHCFSTPTPSPAQVHTYLVLSTTYSHFIIPSSFFLLCILFEICFFASSISSIFFGGGVLIKYHSLEFELHERRICFLCFCVYDIWQCVYFVAALNTCF